MNALYLFIKRILTMQQDIAELKETVKKMSIDETTVEADVDKLASQFKTYKTDSNAKFQALSDEFDAFKKANPTVDLTALDQKINDLAGVIQAEDASLNPAPPADAQAGS